MHPYIRQQMADAYLADRIATAEKHRAARIDRPGRRRPRFALPAFALARPAAETQQ